MEKGLGYIPRAFDRRNLDYPLRRITPEPSRSYRYWNATQWWGDQQQTSACVGYSWTKWLADGPVTQRGLEPKPFDLYREAQKRDPWGERRADDGTTVDACASVLKDKGFIGSYWWAWTLDDAVRGLLEGGPLVLGVNWYDAMFYPNADGLLTVGGNVAGGHAIVANGCNTKTRLIRLSNSWGRSWGKDGYCYLTFDDLARLLEEYGEACLALELAVSP